MGHHRVYEWANKICTVEDLAEICGVSRAYMYERLRRNNYVVKDCMYEKQGTTVDIPYLGRMYNMTQFARLIKKSPMFIKARVNDMTPWQMIEDAQNGKTVKGRALVTFHGEKKTLDWLRDKRGVSLQVMSQRIRLMGIDRAMSDEKLPAVNAKELRPDEAVLQVRKKGKHPFHHSLRAGRCLGENDGRTCQCIHYDTCWVAGRGECLGYSISEVAIQPGIPSNLGGVAKTRGVPNYGLTQFTGKY